jgi:hypothetical protein
MFSMTVDEELNQKNWRRRATAAVIQRCASVRLI